LAKKLELVEAELDSAEEKESVEAAGGDARCSFSDGGFQSRSAIAFHAFDALEMLRCVWPIACHLEQCVHVLTLFFPHIASNL
jgi:hypothetical protein